MHVDVNEEKNHIWKHLRGKLILVFIIDAIFRAEKLN